MFDKSICKCKNVVLAQKFCPQQMLCSKFSNAFHNHDYFKRFYASKCIQWSSLDLEYSLCTRLYGPQMHITTPKVNHCTTVWTHSFHLTSLQSTSPGPNIMWASYQLFFPVYLLLRETGTMGHHTSHINGKYHLLIWHANASNNVICSIKHKNKTHTCLRFRSSGMWCYVFGWQTSTYLKLLTQWHGITPRRLESSATPLWEPLSYMYLLSILTRHNHFLIWNDDLYCNIPCFWEHLQLNVWCEWFSSTTFFLI